MSLENEKLGLTKEAIATKALPFLFPLSIENGLTPSQYNAVMNLIKRMIEKVECEHRLKLEQLNSLQNEQKSALQMSMSENAQLKPDQLVPHNDNKAAGDSDSMLAGLGLGSYVEKKDSQAIATGLMTSNHPPGGVSTAGAISGGGLSLDEKRRMAQQGEALQRLNKPPQMTMQAQKAPTRDLTRSLMDKNLNQMNFSTSAASNSNWANFTSAPAMQQQHTPNFTPYSTTPQQQQQQPKPDLSAFDNLLTMPSSSSRQSMGSMMSPMNPPPQTTSNQANNKPVKSLTANDISDLLS